VSESPGGGTDSGVEGFAPPDGGFAPVGRTVQQMYPVYPAYPSYTSGYYGPPMLRKQTSGLAVTGMVLGILSLLLFWASLLAPLLAILGIVFSLTGISQGSKPGWTGTGMALAGLVCSLLTAAIWVMLAVILATLIA
jgi:hypothetical protein